MAERRRVLVTGLGGAVGGALRPALDERYELSSLSRSGVTGIPSARDFRADIANSEAIAPAFAGQDTVLHLAGYGGSGSPTHLDETPWDEVLRDNIIGTQHVFRAAADAGVGRIVFASSGAAVGGYEHSSPYREIGAGAYAEVPDSWPMIGPLDEPRPENYYAVSKLFGEDLARMYVETTPLSIICVRIGAMVGDDREWPEAPRMRSIYVSPRDLSDLVIRCIEAPDTLRFDIFFGISNNRWNYRDFTHATDVLGHAPLDNAEERAARGP